MKSALLLLAVSAGGVMGCKTNNDLSLTILQVEALLQSSGCVASATVGTERPRGLLDASLISTQGYIAWPLVRNNEVSRIPSSGDPEFNSITLQGANVTLQLTPAEAKAVPDADQKFFYASAGGLIDPAGTAPMFVEALPVKIVNELRGQIPGGGLLTVVASIAPVGKQTSDTVIGPNFDFPIDICDGCLQQSEGTCPFPTGFMAHDVGCIPWQDDVPDCCTSTTTDMTTGQTTTELLCGAAAPVGTGS